MDDAACVRFLQWALPYLHLRWEGFRRVRRHVCRRLPRRLRELSLPDLNAYRMWLQSNPSEWSWLDEACRITISRFHRDRAVWECIRASVLPALARAAQQRADRRIRCWSAGCASGEEAWTLVFAWRVELQHAFPEVRLSVLGTDADELVLERARQARYKAGSLRELPPSWRQSVFEQSGAELLVRQELRGAAEFLRQDLRAQAPEGCFDLVLCRNLAFTYFDEPVQQRVLCAIEAHTSPGAALVVGSHETLPAGHDQWAAWDRCPEVFCRSSPPCRSGAS